MDESGDRAEGELTLSDYAIAPKRRLTRFPRLARAAFAIVWQAAKKELRQCVAIQVLIAIATGLELLVLRDLLSRLVGSKTESFSAVLPDVGAIAALTLITGIASTFLGLRGRLLSLLVSLEATDRVARAAAAFDLITFDRPAFHNRLQRANQAASTRPAQMVQEVIGVANSALSIAAIGVALLIIQPIFCALIVVAYVPVWIATNRAGQLGYRATVEQVERDRLRHYLFDLLTSKPSAQEVRGFGLGAYLADRHYSVHRDLVEEIRLMLLRRLRIAMAGQVISAVLSVLILGLLVLLVTTHHMSVSSAGAAAGALVLLGARLHALSSSSAGLYENSLYMEDYVSFIEAAPALVADRPSGDFDGIPSVLHAERVDFTYPSGVRASLQDVSLTLRRGEIVALVGENGSGKTTLAKLLAGLFRPESGAVSWDGVDVAGLDPELVRRRVAIIFQDFVRYMMSAYDNVAMGNVARYGEREAVEEAARQAGIADTFTELRHGYDTILGPIYIGGTDLSGGQWQRVALARLFFRDAPFVILDEPTASLDPRAEAELFESMRHLFGGRGVLLVTHRFGSARLADRIYVLRDGRLVEEGHHDELMATGGYYADLYELQARSFRESQAR